MLVSLNNIQQQTGVSALTSYNLTLQANVNLTAQTSVGTVKQAFLDSIATNLTIGVLSWTGNLQQSQNGTITSTTKVQTPAKIWGLSHHIPNNIDCHPSYRHCFTGIFVLGSCQKGGRDGTIKAASP